MSGGGGWRDVVDPGGFFNGSPEDWVGNSLDPGGVVHAALGRPSANSDSLANRYGLGDPLNIFGRGGINTSGETPYLANQRAAAEDAATRNAKLPPLFGVRPGATMSGGLGAMYQPRPINYQPMQGDGKMPMIRQRAFGQVMAPFSQPNWGVPAVNPYYLTGIAPLPGGATQ